MTHVWKYSYNIVFQSIIFVVAFFPYYQFLNFSQVSQIFSPPALSDLETLSLF